ncbi:hypothetical protein GF382_02885 [Candidatus Falkowbacteria bacterium]|nr:hypothetical protein [Candidatus Falkowbacteria bacterium]
MQLPVPPNLDTMITGQPNLKSGKEQDAAADRLRRDKKAARDPDRLLKGLSGSDFDSRLLGAGFGQDQPLESADQGQQIAPRESMEGGQTPGEDTESQQGSPPKDNGSQLRAAKLARKRLQEKQAGGQKQAGGPVSSRSKMITARWLQLAWRAALTGVGAIWTYIYCHIHWILLTLFGPNVICRFGEEWFLGFGGASAGKGGGNAGPAQMSTQGMESKIKKLGFLEKMVLVLVDLIILTILIINITILVALLEVLKKVDIIEKVVEVLVFPISAIKFFIPGG